MPAPTDYKTLVYDHLWSLLEAAPESQAGSVASLVRVGNRMKMDAQPGWIKKLFLGKDPAGFPRIEIDNGRFTNSAYDEGLVLATEYSDFLEQGGEWPLTRTAEYVVTVTTDQLPVGQIDQLEEAVQTAFLRGGPGLGFDFVTGWKMAGTQSLSDTGENKDRPRVVTTLRLTVTMTFDGSTFVRGA